MPHVHKKFVNGTLVEFVIDGFPQPIDPTVNPVSPRATQKPSPPADWPIWAKALKLFAKPEDKGIGDVVARTIGDEKSQAFKTWYMATFGKVCGCAGRRGRWNRLYPLQPAGSPAASALQPP